MKLKDKKILFVLIIILLFVVIAFMLYSLFFTDDKQGQDSNTIVTKDEHISSEVKDEDLNHWQNKNINPENIDINKVIGDKNILLTEDEKELQEKAKLEQLAHSFIEIFGSYSTDSHYQNISDIKDFCTNAYWQSLARNISDNNNENEKYSIWTKSLKANLINKEGSNAVVKVLTQREERTLNRTEQPNTFTQTAEIYLLQEGQQWLVNKVKWIDDKK